MKFTRRITLTFERSEEVVVRRRKIVAVSRGHEADENEAESAIHAPQTSRWQNECSLPDGRAADTANERAPLTAALRKHPEE